MKLRVLFLRKRHILYLILAIIITALTIIISSSKGSSTTFSLLINDSKAIKADLTGDGIEDILYIKTEKDKYYIQVNVNEKSFYLEPARKLSTVGHYYSYWPMKITLMDINRDKVPEIFVQASQKSTPIQHIFMWNGSEFKDIFCSSNNIIGFIDTQSNKTPRFITGNLSSNKVNFSYYMYFSNNLQNVNYEIDAIPAKEAVFSFIRYIETLPEGEIYKPQDAFYPGMTGKDLAVIGKLCAENNIYTFQDAVFTDTKVNKNGEITEIKWTLNFKGLSRLTGDHAKNYSITIKLKPDRSLDDHTFKIFNITLNQAL